LYGRELQKGEQFDPIRNLVSQLFQFFVIPGSNGDGALVPMVKPVSMAVDVSRRCCRVAPPG
jgi:hypothetical protein